MPFEYSLLVIQLLATCFMCGLIWVIQLVHYPSFLMLDKKMFVRFEDFHSRRITWIVGPAMLIEIFVAALIVRISVYHFAAWLNLLSVVALWFSTWLLSIPCHKKLMDGFDEKTIARLVVTNWPRTFLWSLRTIILAYALIFYQEGA